jgi:hypothetical protein
MRQPHHLGAHPPGHSALGEYERRCANRRARARARYGMLGSLIAAVTADPGTTDAWRQGAVGEITTARELERHLHLTGVVVLHDRRIPGRGRANIDHLAIGHGGVTVIDTKSTRGQVQVTSTGMLHRRERLLINGCDRTHHLDAIERQIAAVIRVLERYAVGDVGVLGALCFPFMRRRVLHYNRARDGLVIVDDPRHIAKVANRTGPLTAEDLQQLADLLARALPPAR